MSRSYGETREDETMNEMNVQLIADVMIKAQERLWIGIPYGVDGDKIVEDGESYEITKWLSQPLVGLLMDWDPDPTMAAITETYEILKKLHDETDGMDPQLFNYTVIEQLAAQYEIK